MNEIVILKKFPTILTRDVSFLDKIKSAMGKDGIKPGSIIFLPPDAILVEGEA